MTSMRRCATQRTRLLAKKSCLSARGTPAKRNRMCAFSPTRAATTRLQPHFALQGTVSAIIETRPGAEDEHVLALSLSETRVLLTEDKDFGTWGTRAGRRHRV